MILYDLVGRREIHVRAQDVGTDRCEVLKPSELRDTYRSTIGFKFYLTVYSLLAGWEILSDTVKLYEHPAAVDTHRVSFIRERGPEQTATSWSKEVESLEIEQTLPS